MLCMKLIEQAPLTPTAIDADEGVIRGVRVLGPESRNGRRYSDQAIKAAASMYEGVAVNVDHSRGDGERAVADAFGWLRNVAVDGGAVRGDLHYLKAHPQAAVLVEVAQRNPSRLGLSHHAEGTVRVDGGRTIVETIERVYSVDLVQTPATNAGLFESEGHMTIREALERAGMLAVLEGEGMGEYGDVPVAQVNENDYGMSAFESMVLEAMKGSGTMAEKMAKIRKILRAQEMLAGEPAPEIEEGMPKDMAKMAESVQAISARLDGVVALVESMNAERKARELIESSGREVTAERVAAVAMADEGKRQALVESWPVLRSRPQVSPPVAAAKYPQDSRGFMAALKGA